MKCIISSIATGDQSIIRKVFDIKILEILEGGKSGVNTLYYYNQ
jgi:hypothetical protein